MPAHPIVVVGYDGTRAARAAVGRGVERVRDGGHLVVVRAYQAEGTEHDAFHATLLEDAADVAARTLDELAEDEPRLAFVDWERQVVAGDPAQVLCRIAARFEADELIVGTRGLSRLEALLGSVASAVLATADRPVTIMPERMLERAEAVR